MEQLEALTEFISNSVSPFHVVQNVQDTLNKHGFREVKIEDKIDSSCGNQFYVNIHGSSLVAFSIGNDFTNTNRTVNLRIVSTHTDFPCFKLKPNSDVNIDITKEQGYLKLNTEVYGGPILNTWLDRPLSIAGRLILRGKTSFDTKELLFHHKDPIITIPNLAIHMNRDVNKGVELNRQKDLLPLAGIVSKNNEQEQYSFINEIVQSQLEQNHIDPKDLLDYELYVIQCEEGCKLGLHQEFYSSPRLDNLTSVFAQLSAICQVKNKDGINVAIFYDNEEIGSKTKQGASSNIINLLLEKVYTAYGKSRERMIDDILNGMMVSCDVAHAVHPNAMEKSDITNRVMLNGGIVLKIAANQSYANDAVTSAIVKQICEREQVPFQVFANRSDMPGGQTLGSISSTVLPMRTIDIGIPLLAMHSARELMGSEDLKKLEKFLTGFYS